MPGQYLVAQPSRDLLVAGHQRTTRDWWTGRRGGFECYVSQVVIDEASSGDHDEVQKRMAVIADLPVLEVTQDAEMLTLAILALGGYPSPCCSRRGAYCGCGRP